MLGVSFRHKSIILIYLVYLSFHYTKNPVLHVHEWCKRYLHHIALPTGKWRAPSFRKQKRKQVRQRLSLLDTR